MADEKKFLADIQSDDANVRFDAWRRAGEESATAIAQLGKLAASTNPGVAKAALEAITTMTHAVGKDPASAKRPAVVKGLLEIAGAGYALPVRVHALRMLSGIAGEESVPAIAAQIASAELREEVIYCLEQIPGRAPIQAMLTAYNNVRDEFKPRILAALGHRRAAEAVELCAEAMRSPNKEVALAAMKAFARIGLKPAAEPRFPDTAQLSDWEKTEHTDSLLRYADSQAGSPEALRIYRTALERPEEHVQCAAVIGLAKIGTPEAAAAIVPKLKSTNRTVRLTAQQAWKAIAG